MSAHISSTLLRVTTFFLLSFLTLLLTMPTQASADTLEQGVLEHRTCGEYAVSVKPTGTGMIQNAPLATSARRVAHISATENCAVVTWSTMVPAATQVIYAELSDEPVEIKIDEPFFGYAFGTPQNNAGIADHTAILTDLEPGKAYAYRLVTRAHPSALPVISEAQVLIAGPSLQIETPVEVVVPMPSEKNPVTVDTTPETPHTPTSPSTTDDNKVVLVPNQNPEDTVPSAINAANQALGETSLEGAFWSGIRDIFRNIFASAHENTYIVPVLILIAILFITQRFVLPLFGLTITQPLVYWLFGATIVAVLSAVFMFYYVTLIAIAVFLATLAWYLLQTTPEEPETISTPTQPKLLETKESKSSKKKKK